MGYNTRMKIISWNVNGLRALHKKGQFDWIIKQNPDIFCLQETKSRADQLPEEVRSPKGYTPYFSWPTEKKGYSGVAVYSKKEADHVEKGLNDDGDDFEGRLITAYFDDFVLLNVYFPNGGGSPERLKYKLEFYKEFLAHIESIRRIQPKILFCGDVNTAHKEIDLARPKENEQNTGFLPEERAWIDKVVQHGYVDVYRHFNPQISEVYTYWDMKTYARERNVGWRIDYFFASKELLRDIKDIKIHMDVGGSDHCPLEVNLF